MKIITCDMVSKSFHRHGGQVLLREHLAYLFGRNRELDFHALKGVSCDVVEGEGVAVIGSNGAGKSALLSIVAGLAKPDTGSVQVNGRIAALLELGSGFHPDLTGTENVYLNAALLGFTEKQTKEMFGTIVDFAAIGDFIDEPLRTYSSGMWLRLAFSVAVNVDPEILIVDAVLAVRGPGFSPQSYAPIPRLR